MGNYTLFSFYFPVVAEFTRHFFNTANQGWQLHIIFILFSCSCRVYSAILLTPFSPPLWHWRASKVGNYTLFSFYFPVVAEFTRRFFYHRSALHCGIGGQAR